MTHDLLGVLLLEADAGAEDSLNEHLALHEEMARSAGVKAGAGARTFLFGAGPANVADPVESMRIH